MIDDMQVYIANLGKYNEGELVGDWFSFPLDEEVIAERIGLNAEYEEYAIHDTDNFPMEISEYTSIEELNRIYEQLEELPDYLLDDLDSFISCYGSLTVLVLPSGATEKPESACHEPHRHSMTQPSISRCHRHRLAIWSFSIPPTIPATM